MKTVTRYFLNAAKCFVCLLLMSQVSLYAELIMHTPPDSIESGQPLLLSLEMPEDGDYEIKCFYRFNNAEEYQSEELVALSPRHYRLEVIVPEQSRNLKYFFWIYKDGEYQQTYPEEDPMALPFTVLNMSYETRYFDILSPDISETVPYKKQQVFVLRNNFPVKASFISAHLNDDESLMVLSKSKVLMTLQSTFPLRQGKNRMKIKAELVDGTVVEEVIYFKTSKEKVRKEDTMWTGETELYHLIYSTTKEASSAHDNFEMAYSTRVSRESKRFRSEFYGLFDNRDSEYEQPYSRFSASAKDQFGRWTAEAGDIRKRYSPLTIEGRRIRGAALSTDFFKWMKRSSSLNFSWVYGLSNRAIEVSSGNVTAATYEQYAKGFQLKYRGSKTKLGVQYFHIKDTEESIVSENSGGTAPVENYLLSAFYNIRMSSLAKFDTELAASAYYSDTRADVQDISSANIPENLKGIVENYLPIKSSIAAGLASKTTLQMPFFSKNHIAKVNYDYIQPGFVNVLNSGLETDKSDLKVALTSKLFKKKLVLTSQYSNKVDNILKGSPETTMAAGGKLNAVYQTKKMGSLNSSWFITRRTNSFAVSGNVITTDNVEIDNRLSFYLFSWAGIPLKTKYGKMKMNLNYSLSQYQDFKDSANNSETNSIGMSIASKYKRYKYSFGLNQATSTSTLSGETVYMTLDSKINRSFKKRKNTTLQVKTKVTYGNNNNEDEAYKLNTIKFSHSWGIIHTKKPFYYFKSSKLRAAVEFVAMSDSEDSEDANSNFTEWYITFRSTNAF